MTELLPTDPRPVWPGRVALVLTLTAAELLAIALVFQFAVDFDCRASGAYGACMAVRNSLGRGIAILAAVAIVPTLRDLVLALPLGRRAMPWALVQAAGVTLILAPALAPVLAPALTPAGDFAPTFRASLLFWAAGATLAAAGTLLWLAAPAHWARLLRPSCLVPVAMALAAPEILGLADGLWRGATLPDLTFAAVARGLAPFGAVEVFPAERLIHLDDFAVQVAGPCSGMEGFALITALLGGHLWLHRTSLRWPHALALFPLALAASFALNALRVGGLVLIGARISPDLAVNGFHSHAGWLAFTLLAFALIALTRLRCLRADRGEGAAVEPRAPDEIAALILPFAATMLAVLALDTFAPDPAAWYPLRTAVMAAVLVPFAAAWRRLGAPDAVAVAAGVAVGLAWLAAAPATTPAAAPWAAARLIGAVALTPLVEEAFFRGYLQPRLIRAGLPPVLAVGLAAAPFGLLHDRWLAGTLAGAAFGFAALRRGRLVDALGAHIAANATLAAWAIASGDWSGF